MSWNTTIRTLFASTALAAVVSLGGCGSALYDAQAAFKAGDMVTAQKKISGYAKKNVRSEHRVIAHLELGSILYEAGRFEESVSAFQFAEKQMEGLDNQKEYKFSEELEAAVKNPAEITYRGTPYDRVMSSVMLGLGYSMVGDFEAARPALRNAQFRQDEAITKRQEMLDDAQKEAEENEDLQNANVAAGERYNEGFFVGYDSVSNSFADAVQAAFLLGQQLSTTDADEANFLFGRVASVNPQNSYAEQDASIAQDAAGQVPNRTFVFFGSGFSPYMIEIPIALPYPGGIATAAFPILKEDDFGFVQSLSIGANGQSFAVEPLADMDSIVGADFKAELPLIITRHTASALTKNGVGVGASATANQVGGFEGLIIQLTAWAYQIWQNKADIRSWQTLPKYYMYASFPTPTDGVISLAASPTDTRSIEVSPTGVNIVVVRALRPNLPVSVSSFNVGTETIVEEPAPEPQTETAAVY